MSTSITDIITEFIRTADPDNITPADFLGWAIAEKISGLGHPVNPAALSAYVRDINSTKQLDATHLARHIIERFNLT
jgi:hypothetical protein